jgi:protein SCO1
MMATMQKGWVTRALPGTPGRRVLFAALLAAPLAALAPAASAHDAAHAGHAASPASGSTVGKPTERTVPDARAYFTDTELIDQNGRTVRFYSDTLQDRIVVINVVYTNCEDACPMITHALTDVRKRLGDRFGKDVFFISISNDPKRDSPQALKKFAAEQGADHPGWTFLTGSEANVKAVLSRLGQFSPEVEAHSTLLIAGNVGAKRWNKIRPDANPAAIVERLLLLAEGGKAPGALAAAKP